MSKKIDIKVSKLLANNWIITLTATLIGVFLALYLTEWISSKNLENQKEIATKNMLAEISNNHKILETSLERHVELNDLLKFIETYTDENDDFITAQDTMNKFRNLHPGILIIKDSTYLTDGNYLYRCEANMDFNLTHLEMTNIAWSTMKNSGVNAHYDFECLMYLEKIDMTLNEVLEYDEKLIELLSDLFKGKIEKMDLLKHLESLIVYEKILNEMYKQSEEKLENCS